MSRTTLIYPEQPSQGLILINETPLNANLESIINYFRRNHNPETIAASFRNFFQRFRADINNRENLPTRLRQSLELFSSAAGLTMVYAGVFSGEQALLPVGMVLADVGTVSFLTELIIDRRQRYNQRRTQVAVGEPNQIDRARFGLQPEFLNQALNCGVTSLLNDFSESVIAALKTNPASSAQDAVALMNHIFTQTPLATDLSTSLDEDSLASARSQKDILMRHRLDYGANFYADRQRHPITDPCLIQTLAYAHFIGALQKARSTNDPVNNLPNVDLDDLRQKYEGFYEKFTSHCERIDSESGREFAETFLHPILRDFATDGEYHTITPPAPNHVAVVDIETGINPPLNNDLDEIAPIVFRDTPRTTTAQNRYSQIVPINDERVI